MKKYKLHIAIALIIALILMALNFISSQNNEHSIITQDSKQKFSSSDSELISNPNPDEYKTLINEELNYKQCRLALRSIHFDSKRLRHRFEVPEDIIRQYKSEDILTALAGLQVATTTFRNQLKKQDRAKSKLQKRFNTNGQQPPNDFYTSEINGEKTVDMTTFFEQFLVLSEQERTTVAASIPLLADDATQLFNGQFNEREILEVLEHIENIDTPIDSKLKIQGTGLLELAAINGMFEVFNYLYNRIDIIRDRPTLNTLEVLILSQNKNTLEDNNEKTESIKKIVELLLNHDMLVRIRELKANSRLLIGGAASNAAIDILSAKNKEFFESLGVDLSTRITHEYFLQMSDSILVEDLILHINSKLTTEHDLNFKKVQHCRSVILNVNNYIKRFNVQETIEETTKNYDYKIQDVSLALHKIEPGLADLYRLKMNEQTSSSYILNNMNNRAFRLFRMIVKDDYNIATENINSASLSNAEKSFIFWAVIRTDIRHLRFLTESDILPQYEDYNMASQLNSKKLNKIIGWGLKFDSTDQQGKTLAFYASLNCNLELINFINENNFPYHQAQYGVDPLGVAIRHSNCSGESKARLIDILMTSKVEVLPYHLQRMAELRLLDSDSFNEIVKLHPILQPSINTMPSGYYIKPYDEIPTNINENE